MENARPTSALPPVPRLLALAAGTLDFGTGLALVFAPSFALQLMLIGETPGAEALIYLRFVGAFVAAVGLSYLLALARGTVADLRAVFIFTIPFRLFAGLFTAAALVLQWLPWPWLSVPVTDFSLVALQLYLVSRTLRATS